VLRANWARERLSKLVFVGNQFSGYVDSNPVRKMEAGFPYLLRVVSLLDSRPFPILKCCPTAFNNTSVQFVRTSAQGAEASF